MRALIAHLSTLLLVLHTAMGCCWHHGHQCASSQCSNPTEIALVCPGHGHAGHSHRSLPAERDHSDDEPCRSGHGDPSHHCDGGTCSYVLVKISAEQIESAAATGLALLADWPLASQPLLCSQVVSAGPTSAELSAPPVRTHLLCGVLLI